MPYKPPKLSPDASEFARKVHAYLMGKGLAVKSWAKKADVNPSSLFNLFSNVSDELDTQTIIKLANVSGPSLFYAVGMSPPPKGELDLDMTTAQKVTELLQAILDVQRDIHEEQRVIRAQNAEIIRRLGGDEPAAPDPPALPGPVAPSPTKPS